LPHSFHRAREIKPERHGNDLSALVECPLNAAEDHFRAAAAVVSEDLADQRFLDAARNADASPALPVALRPRLLEA
jgi:hypothetical protein